MTCRRSIVETPHMLTWRPGFYHVAVFHFFSEHSENAVNLIIRQDQWVKIRLNNYKVAIILK